MKKTSILLACALGAIAVAVYAPVRTFDFVSYDDPFYITKNPHIAGGFSMAAVRWAFTSGYLFYWQPVTWLSHMLDVELFGTSAGGHHVVNLILHIASTLVLFAWLLRTTRRPGPSAFVAALFAIHPLHVESVAWVAERKDVLSTLFCFLTLWAYAGYARARETGGIGPESGVRSPESEPADKRPRTSDLGPRSMSAWSSRYLLVLLFFALALMAKPMVVTLPVVLLLVDWWPLGRMGSPEVRTSGRPAVGENQLARGRPLVQLVVEKIPLVVMAAAAGVATVLVQAQVGAVGGLNALPLNYRLANAVVSYVAYLRMMVWPDRLAVFYPYPAALPPWSLVVGAVVGLAAMTVAVFRLRHAAPYLLAGWLWYLVTLAPVIGLFQAGDQLRADRFTYVPLVGVFVMIAWGVVDLPGKSRAWQRGLAMSAVLVVAGYATVARAQVDSWRDSETLWTRALAVTSFNHRAHANMAALRAGQGRTDEAIAEYREALRIVPATAEWRNNLGLLYVQEGRLAESIGQFAIATRVQPGFADAHANLGAVLARTGNLKDAIPEYRAALGIRPGDALTHFNLALALHRQRHIDEALAECLLALGLDPSKADWHYEAAALFNEKGDAAETRAHLEKALQVDPHHEQARRALDALMKSPSQAPR